MVKSAILWASFQPGSMAPTIRRHAVEWSTPRPSLTSRVFKPLSATYSEKVFMRQILHIMQATVKGNLAHCEITLDARPCDHCPMNLAKIRASRDLTLEQLGEMIGLSASTVQRAEIMHHTAKLGTYSKCAAALGVTLADLFCDDRTQAEDAIIAAIRGLSDDRRDILLGMSRVVEGQP